MSLAEAAMLFPSAKVVSGIGSPRIRQKVMEKAAATGFTFDTIIHPHVEHSRWIEIGEGYCDLCGQHSRPRTSP